MDRTKFLGGSDMGAILGCSKFKTKYELYLEKIGQMDSFKGNKNTEYGNMMEPVIGNMFVKEKGLKLEIPNPCYHDSEHDFLKAHLDYKVLGENVGVEIKNSGCKFLWDNIYDPIPEMYFAQVQFYMMITGWDKFYMCVFLGGSDIRIFNLERDKWYIEMMRNKAISFWINHVIPKKPPAISSDDSDVLLNQFSDVHEDAVKLPKEVDEYGSRLKEISLSQNVLTREKKELENKIKLQIGNASQGLGDEYRFNWTHVDQHRIDSTKLKEEFPDIYKQVQKKISTRRFSVGRVR